MRREHVVSSLVSEGTGGIRKYLVLRPFRSWLAALRVGVASFNLHVRFPYILTYLLMHNTTSSSPHSPAEQTSHSTAYSNRELYLANSMDITPGIFKDKVVLTLVGNRGPSGIWAHLKGISKALNEKPSGMAFVEVLKGALDIRIRMP